MGGSSVSLLYITEFINFIERIKIGKDTILVPMDVSNLYTNIPQEEGPEEDNSLPEGKTKLIPV